jgi:signal transduction histidine kinase
VTRTLAGPLSAGVAALVVTMLMLVAVYALLVGTSPGSGVVHIERIEWLLSDSPVPPTDEEGWQQTSLPLQWTRGNDTRLVGAWYRARFALPADSTDLMSVYLPRFDSGGTVWVNDQKIGAVPTADAATHVRWFRPFLFPVGSDGLNVHENVLMIRQQTRDVHVELRDIVIGPYDALHGRYQSLLFWQYTMAVLAASFCVAVGAFMIALWLRRPDEEVIALFGVACLLWAFRSLTFIVEVIPIQWWFAWRGLYYVATGGFIAMMSIGLVRFANRQPSWHVPVALGYWLIGVTVFIVVGWPARPWLDHVWVLGFVPFLLHAMWLLAQAVRREPGLSRLLLLLALVGAGGMALHDFLVAQGAQVVTRNHFFGLHLAAPAVLAALGLHLLDRFARSLADAERLNRTLEQEVAARGRQLAENYQRLRVLEREQALAFERQRIMREMHDGVGSQLLSSLVMVERGGARPKDIANMLRECLDDMRLAIDTLTPETTELAGALGNLRYRVEPRLRAAGVSSHWDTASLPENLPINPHQSLQLLRVVQEALANVFKHATAERVDVSARIEAEGLVIHVSDNGRGFAADSIVAGTDKGDPGRDKGDTGRGLRNMRRRAREAGAVLQIESGPTGTRVRLVRPLSEDEGMRPLDAPPAPGPAPDRAADRAVDRAADRAADRAPAPSRYQGVVP